MEEMYVVVISVRKVIAGVVLGCVCAALLYEIFIRARGVYISWMQLIQLSVLIIGVVTIVVTFLGS